MCVFVAASQAGEIAGTVACNVIKTGEGHVRGMAVTQNGTALVWRVSCFVRWRQSCSAGNVLLASLDTPTPLQRATRFYKKHGYRRSGKVTDFFGMELFEYVKELGV
jgi:hypothetical protein